MLSMWLSETLKMGTRFEGVTFCRDWENWVKDEQASINKHIFACKDMVNSWSNSSSLNNDWGVVATSSSVSMKVLATRLSGYHFSDRLFRRDLIQIEILGGK